MISIIVPVYKAENYIADTIRTVVQQTYTDWELLLVDDKSPDHSCEVIEKTLEDLPGETAARIHLIRKEKNEGAARARNTGVDAAKGRYIAFLDAAQSVSLCSLTALLKYRLAIADVSALCRVELVHYKFDLLICEYIQILGIDIRSEAWGNEYRHIIYGSYKAALYNFRNLCL